MKMRTMEMVGGGRSWMMHFAIPNSDHHYLKAGCGKGNEEEKIAKSGQIL